eukprot:SAG11_NODE_27604_length_331_cov_0.392241_1_plen_91_part_10
MDLAHAGPHGYQTLICPERCTKVQQTREVTDTIETIETARRNSKVMILASETAGFSQMCRWLPVTQSFCLEIGSAHGIATKILSDACPGGK